MTKYNEINTLCLAKGFHKHSYVKKTTNNIDYYSIVVLFALIKEVKIFAIHLHGGFVQRLSSFHPLFISFTSNCKYAYVRL